MCHIGLPPTNRNWGYFTAIFLSGSWTVSSNGTQVSSFSPKMAWFYRRKTHERSVLDIRLSSRSKRCPGILLKILVLNLCFKVTNYAKSWFHGHSCTTLPITTQLGVYCHSCAAWGDVEAYLCWYWCHWNTQENHLDANFHQSPQPTSKDQGFILSFYIWSKKFADCSSPHFIPVFSRFISSLRHCRQHVLLDKQATGSITCMLSISSSGWRIANVWMSKKIHPTEHIRNNCFHEWFLFY